VTDLTLILGGARDVRSLARSENTPGGARRSALNQAAKPPHDLINESSQARPSRKSGNWIATGRTTAP